MAEYVRRKDWISIVDNYIELSIRYQEARELREEAHRRQESIANKKRAFDRKIN